MTPEEFEEKIEELSVRSEIHTELILYILNQVAEANAQLEAVMAGHREILFKMTAIQPVAPNSGFDVTGFDIEPSVKSFSVSVDKLIQEGWLFSQKPPFDVIPYLWSVIPCAIAGVVLRVECTTREIFLAGRIERKKFFR